MADAAASLRALVLDIRRKPVPIFNIIPTLDAGATEIEALRARVAELEQLLDEGSAYVHSFAMLSKHPTAPAYAMDLSQRMRVAAGLSGNKSPQCFSTKETDRG